MFTVKIIASLYIIKQLPDKISYLYILLMNALLKVVWHMRNTIKPNKHCKKEFLSHGGHVFYLTYNSYNIECLKLTTIYNDDVLEQQ